MMSVTKRLSSSLPPAVNTLVTVGVPKVRRGLAVTLRTNAGRVGFFIVLVHGFLAIFGPYVVPYNPTEFDSEALAIRLDGPSWDHLLGTDHFGRDVFSRVIAGARSIVWISVAGTALVLTLGTIVGLTSAYLGGKVDQLLMRIVDVNLAFPGLLLALLVLNMATKWLTGIDESWIIIVTIGISSFPTNSRVIRSAALAIKPQEFVQSARLRGESVAYIIFREILPNVVPVIGVEASIRISFALLLTASLGFLGLGVQPPTPDWGLMVSESRKHLSTAPWAAVAPALAMASLVVGVNILADGIRQSVQLPKSRDAQ